MTATATQTTVKIEPYLFFDGRCEEAIAFYKEALGAEVLMTMRYKDMPPEAAAQGKMPPEAADKIMHTSLMIGDTRVMAADHCGQGAHPKFDGFSLSIGASDEATATKMFNALAKGGQVRMPLGKTFFSPCFGMVADKFGVGWMVIVAQN
jgi:PhnB protein